jgi:hypothetical protein
MNSGELRDLWMRLLSAMEAVDDVSALIGPSDRKQAARLRQIAQSLAPEIAVLAQKITAARKAERGNHE